MTVCISQDQLTKRIIEAVQPDETSPGIAHSLPPHAIVSRDKATAKVHVVHDASARSANGRSLNDCLHKGSKVNQLIFDHLVRFSSYKVALTADLEKVFLIVLVEEVDHDMLWFCE